MKVRLKFNGMPLLKKKLNKGEVMEIDFPGMTLQELIARLIGMYGAPIREALLNRNGDLDREIKVALNDATYLTGNRMETLLSDGDIISFSAIGC